jgi:predicted DNA-binding WGR domain protein
MTRREFHFVEGSSKKFWAIEFNSTSFTVHFGRIGTAGQAKEKTFSSEELARREHDKLILEKTKNGYVEVEAGACAGPTPAPKAAAAATASAAVRSTQQAENAPADAARAEAAPEAASCSAQAGTAIAAPAGELQRRVRLPDEEWRRVRWRPHKPVPPAEPKPFDFAACVKKLNSVRSNWYFDRDKLAKLIPARLSKEEAWFWLNALDAGHNDRTALDSWLREAEGAGLADDADIRGWAQMVSKRSDDIYFASPQTLRPFFTPLEIAGLILEAMACHAGGQVAADTPRFMLGFSSLVVPYMSVDERRELRSAIERMYDAEPDRSARKALWLLALLSTVGGGPRLAAHAASQPDNAWQNSGWFWRSGGFLDMLAGLEDEASFVHEARRLIGRLSTPADLRLWLAASEWRELDLARDVTLAMTAKDEAAAMARVMALVEAPEAALPMLEVQLGSKAPAIAAEWLSAHPLHAAVGLAPAAMGQGKLADAARDHLHAMRRDGLAPVLSAALAHLSGEQGAWLQREILNAEEEAFPEAAAADLPEALCAAFADAKAAKPPGWLSMAGLPAIKLGGKRLAAGEVGSVLAALRAKPDDGAGIALVSALKEHADRNSLDAFAWKLFDLWQGMGAPSKDKWAMGAIGRLGGDGCVLKLTPLVREWPGESQHARAVFGLECLREVGTDTALMALNGIAQKLKFKGLKQKAQEMMEGVAQSSGLTREQLADRIVPDCGLDERGSRVFDFGPRQFRFVLGPEMKPLVRDAAGKVRPELPAPNKTDDQDKAEAAVAEWKLLKKTLREVLKIQAERLEDAMITGRRWTPEEFDSLLVKHPLMVNLVRQLVLAAYDGAGKVAQTFRVTEDQTLADHNDEETVLPSGPIGVVHPAHLDDALKSAWGQVLSDYEIIPPFAQLGRDICRPDPADLDSTGITRYRGPKIPGIVMYGMLERSHWLRDTPADGGGFVQHSKHFPSANLTAFIRYTGLSMGYYEESQELEEVYFVAGHITPTWWGEHKNRLRIKDVDTVVLSEVLRLANAIASKAE